MQKWSIVYRNLKPFILADIGAGNSGAGGTTLASVPLHGLADTSKHSGQLSTAQAPWAVTTSVFAAHTGNTNAHHNQVHTITGTDHTVTGSQWQIVGLTAANTLGLLTASATPGVNQVVKTDGSSKVTLATAEVTGALYVDDIVDFGTDYITEGATYLSVFGTKPVYFNQAAQSSGWSISTAGAAQFNGGVTVTANDLLVNGTGTYAGVNVLFADSSGGNVGIDCVPDPQFALDVFGPARATYFVGPHALQLKGALMICHYDGKEPFESNFTGDSNGHMGQIGTATGGVIYTRGKFGKAVQMAPATTNLVSNPSFETNTTGWNALSSATLTRLASESPLYGSYTLRVQTTGGNSGGAYFQYTSGAVSNYTGSVSVKAAREADIGFNVSLLVRINYTDASTEDTSVNFTMTSSTEWTRLSAAANKNGAKTISNVQLHVRDLLSQTAHLWEMDGAQLESGLVATPYCDGSLGGYSASGVQDGSGHSWSGTAHASTSSRVATVLSYPTDGNLRANRWTIAAWVYVESVSISQYILRVVGTSAGNIILQLSSTGYVQAYAGTTAATSASPISMRTWTHVGATYDGTTVRAYINGMYAGKAASSGFSGMPATMSVGCVGAANYLNGMIDELLILDRAMTASANDECTEMRAVYESNAPVFAESSRYAFRATPKNLVWGDDEGLWVRDTAGNAVFGIYGNETGGKSWGNFTMDVGDIVIGTNSASKSAIRWDASAGTFGFYGNGNATAQVKIATTGVLTAGGDRVTLDASGVKIVSEPWPTTPQDATNTSRLHWTRMEMYEDGYQTWVYPTGPTTVYRFNGILRMAATYGLQESPRMIIESLYENSSGIWSGPRIQLDAGPFIEDDTVTYGFKQLVELNSDIVRLRSRIVVVEDDTAGTYLYIKQGSTTYAQPVLRLSQADLSEEFIQFDTTVGAGNAVDTAALGTYYGKVRVSVNGTFKWLALYN